MKPGQLIVLTGIDGSGKTTQAKLLVEDLKKMAKRFRMSGAGGSHFY